MDTKHDIPHREIGEQDDELLEQLWKQLPDSQEDPFIADQGFKDLQGRIQRKLRIKHRFRILTAGSIAAALITGVLIFRTLIPSEQVPTAIAQLQDMGVTISDDQVILKMGNEVVMSLDSAARIELNTADDVALQTAAGKKLALASERILKLEVPAGRHFQMTLSDGTKVWLNASSTLEYPASFEGKKERRVRLTGEAFFEVSRNEKCPFYVETGNQESVQVLGTSFNINAYPENSKHFTTLVTGKISYQVEEGKEPVILSPDQQVSFDCVSGDMKVAQVDASAFAAWKDGWIYFEDETLPDLAKRLSRVYGVEIKVAERLRNYSFSGKISYERGVDYITRLMEETNGVVCEVENGVLWLR